MPRSVTFSMPTGIRALTGSAGRRRRLERAADPAPCPPHRPGGARQGLRCVVAPASAPASGPRPEADRRRHGPPARPPPVSSAATINPGACPPVVAGGVSWQCATSIGGDSARGSGRGARHALGSTARRRPARRGAAAGRSAADIVGTCHRGCAVHASDGRAGIWAAAVRVKRKRMPLSPPAGLHRPAASVCPPLVGAWLRIRLSPSPKSAPAQPTASGFHPGRCSASRRLRAEIGLP